jgi:hypothetical protein
MGHGLPATGYIPMELTHTLVETHTQTNPWAMGTGKWWVWVRVSSWIPTGYPCHCLRMTEARTLERTLVRSVSWLSEL